MTYLKLFHVKYRSPVYVQVRERCASKKYRRSHSWFVPFLNQVAFIEQQQRKHNANFTPVLAPFCFSQVISGDATWVYFVASNACGENL